MRFLILLLCLAWPAWADETVLVQTCLILPEQSPETGQAVTFRDHPTNQRTILRASHILAAQTLKTTPESKDCAQILLTGGNTIYVRVIQPRRKGDTTIGILERLMDRQ